MNQPPFRSAVSAFTMIELLVVISIITVLMGLAFPAFQAVQNSAKKTQAKNDLVQLVTAVNAFYTEYGKYPTTATDQAGAKLAAGGTSSGPLFAALRGTTSTLNTRQIVFMSIAEAKDQTNPRNGIKTSNDVFYDPWGKAYGVDIDADYDNQTPNPYDPDTGAGTANIRQGAIAWSLGKNQLGGSGVKSSADASDDVISWQ